MQTLTKHIIEMGLANRILSETQLARALEGSDQRRYHLVNRAMKAGELLRLRRGAYLLGPAFRDGPAHPFALAQAFVPCSYVSFETALSYHGWIPEAVHVTASVTPGSKSQEYSQPEFGRFSFHPLAIHDGSFLELVTRARFGRQSALIAEPFRALMDLVCQRKQSWKDMSWLTEGLRIDSELLGTISKAEIATLIQTYKHRRVQEFLTALSRAPEMEKAKARKKKKGK